MNFDTDYSKNLLSFTWAETYMLVLYYEDIVQCNIHSLHLESNMSLLARKINVNWTIQPGKVGDSKCKDNN